MGKRVAFTASIMDMCHDGHINLLKEMRKRGDYVVVVIHSDEACFRIKNKFPIQSTQHRKKNILSTGLVDKVYVTKSIDPADKFAKILRKHKNRVFVRGDDNMNPPGKWLLDLQGVEQVYIPYTKGISSSKLRDGLCNS
jgi:glycerol-3-phosphate cytidylyltransferase